MWHTYIPTLWSVQAYLGDISGSVLEQGEYPNKEIQVNFFLFPSAYEGYVYTTL